MNHPKSSISCANNLPVFFTNCKPLPNNQSIHFLSARLASEDSNKLVN